LKKIIIEISTPITYGYSSSSGTESSQEEFTSPEPIRDNYIDQNSHEVGSHEVLSTYTP
jgi:hypothetical protein